MNKKLIRNYQIFSVVFTFILGTLLHFTYNLSGENKFVAFFSSVNESVWEHLKLLFFPMLLTTIIGYFWIGKNYSNFICAKTFGIVLSLVLMVVFFYTYTGIIGKNIAIIDIISFFIITVIGEFISYILIVNKYKCNSKIAIFVLSIIFLSLVIFTYFTPKLNIFKDSINGNYGINSKKY